jgi:hypothetical protein
MTLLPCRGRLGAGLRAPRLPDFANPTGETLSTAVRDGAARSGGVHVSVLSKDLHEDDRHAAGRLSQRANGPTSKGEDEIR